jgi:hypothetical protein
MDDDLLDFVKARVADETGLSSEWGARLRGSSLAELRADAAQLRRTLRLDPEPSRGDDGRFSIDMNARLRRRVGRG